MNNTTINYDVCSYPEHLSNTLHNSIEAKFKITDTQTYYPHINKFVSINSDKCNKQYTLNSKFKCVEILNIIDDDNSTVYIENAKDHIHFDIETGKHDDAEETETAETTITMTSTMCMTNNYTCMCNISKFDGQPYKYKSFIKILPIINPLKKLKLSMNMNINNINIPNLYNFSYVSSINNYNNSSYLECFFTYLASKLVENGLCPSFPYYYGSVNGTKEEFYFDITDEYKHIRHNKWFKLPLKNKEFELISIDTTETSTSSLSSLQNSIYSLSGFSDIDDIIEDMTTSPVRSQQQQQTTDEIEAEEFDEANLINYDNVLRNHKYDKFYLKLSNYPVIMNITEKLEYTLDELIEKNYNITEKEWLSILFQISFGLAVAQKHYNFTHNDLHSSNIMFKYTPRNYIYYHHNKRYYKIPTYNKIVKIIDFGRAIFKFKDIQYFSDVFQKGGDAQDQYQYNVKYGGTFVPNYSFDLARLATTIEKYITPYPAITKLITRWMTTDNGRVLHDINNSEDFSLYMNITKYCHNAVPHQVLRNPIFKIFEINYYPRGNFVYYL